MDDIEQGAMPSARATGLTASAPDGSSQSSVPIAAIYRALCLAAKARQDAYNVTWKLAEEAETMRDAAEAIETQSVETGTGSVPKG